MKSISSVISLNEFRNKFLKINWVYHLKLRCSVNYRTINITRDAIILQLEDWNL